MQRERADAAREDFLESVLRRVRSGAAERLRPRRRTAAELADRLAAAAGCKLRAGEAACREIASVPDLDLRMALSQQAWQEFRHLQLLTEHLRRLGWEAVPGSWAPPGGGSGAGGGSGPDVRSGPGSGLSSPESGGLEVLFTAACTEDGWLERLVWTHLVAERWIGDALRATADLARALGDLATADLVGRQIEPDEVFHREIGVMALRRHAATGRARAAVVAALGRGLAAAERLIG